MSAGATGPTGPLTINVAPRFAPTDTHVSGRPSPVVARLIRITAFAALGGYGLLRWATLVSPAPTGRLIGLLCLSVAIVAAVPALERIGRPPAIVATGLLCLVALPVAGLNWHDFLHLRIAVGARAIGDGLSGLPASFVPYAGASHDIRTVIALGAAVLLLDGAVVLAFAPAQLGDARRAGAALPLVALAVVPSTLLRPQLPYLQGFILFALLVIFVWGERAHRQGRRLALLVLGVAGLAGAVIAPRLDSHHAWLDYRAWTGGLTQAHPDQFVWNQHYGPLHWPRSGHVVFTVAARRPDYWKAEDLDMFDGYGWVSASVNAPPLPPPAPDLLARWSQTIDVSVIGLRSTAVIAAGLAEVPTLPGRTTLGGNAEGTWGSDPPLGPGSQYTVQTYSPRPSPGQLSRAGTRYPAQNLAPYLSLSVPIGSGPAPAVTQIQFAAFHQPARAASPMLTRMIGPSPYGPVYALARRLAAGARTPYAYAVAVSRYLSAHYTYNENPPARRYPLVSFLFHDKIGYCQQFSGAMAMLLRMGGVPARVAAGFTTGSRDAHGRFQVTDIDAHAWVEAWFPHYGWVRFDPTPGIAPARGGTPPAGILKTLPGSIGPARAAPRRDAGASAAAATSGQHRHSSGMSPWLLLPAGLLVVLGGLLFALVIAPEPGPDEQLRELERALARTGRPIGPEVTLVALEHRFRDSPSAAGYIRALRLSRYAGLTPPAVPGGRPALREQLREGLGVTGRLRALWALPPRPGLGRRVGRGRPTSH